MMKALSQRQALACEMALHRSCRCRCGGKLHGAGRSTAGVLTDRSFFEALPVDDPHHLRTAKEECARRKLRRADAKEARRLALGQMPLFPEPEAT